jgi:hypothetical protein
MRGAEFFFGYTRRAAPRGGYIDLEKFRHREWTPALRAAGLATPRPVHDASFVRGLGDRGRPDPLAQLATIMGTSIRELEDTYHRWRRRTDEQLRAALDAYDEQKAV